MKATSTPWLGILLVLVMLLGCSQYRTVNNPPPKVTIGVIAPFSGPLAEYGDAIRNGLELSLNDSTAQNFAIVYEDSEYDPVKAISAYQKLTTIDHAALVINFGNPTTRAIAPLSNDVGVPLIGFDANVGAKLSSHYEIRALKEPQDYMATMQTYLQAHHYKKIGLLVTQTII